MKAVFVGRFQPFHNGHLRAIKWILNKNPYVFIIIGSIQEFNQKDNPFTANERKLMLEKSLSAAGIKNFSIGIIPDLYNDILWAKTILKILGAKAAETTVYTKNNWTENCLKKIGVNVEEHPIFFEDLCATKIRNGIFNDKKWNDLIPKTTLDYLNTINGVARIKSSSVFPEEKIIKFIKQKIVESGLKGGIIGVSGGLDSAVTSFLAKKALKDKAMLVWLPFVETCPFKKNILLLEKSLKTRIKKIYLDDVYARFLRAFPKISRISAGNLKPRVRMSALYYFANLHKLLVIGATNKSEMEIGYFTKYGDGGVDIEPIADLYKTEVFEMAKRLKIPDEIISIAPTAALWPGQTDEKEIGLNYRNLDTILKLSAQGFAEKEISFLTGISQVKIKNITERKRKNAHKLAMPPICRLNA